MKQRARLFLSFAVSLPLLLAAAQADASAMCDRLQARLSSLPDIIGGNAAESRKYASAIARQNIQLRKVRIDLRRLGCSAGSIVVFGGPNAEMCDTLESAMADMEDNLATLEAKRRQAAGGDNRNARRRVLAAIEANGCNDERGEVFEIATSGPRETRPFSTPTVPAFDESARTQGSGFLHIEPLGGTGGSGHLRTMCVRTCDGAFFPISSSATPLDFKRDAQVCSMMCPGTQTELYFHSLTSQETDEMVSTATGKPYSLLPTAFTYRTRDLSKPDGCGCNLSAYYQEMMRRENALQSTPHKAGQTQESAIIDVKPARVQAGTGEKPPEKKPVEDRPYDPSSTRVRTVGPTFLPPQEETVDLKHPAGPGYQSVQ